MKKLLKHTIYFCLPLILLLIFIPVNSRLKYQGLSGDCDGRALWLHDRIYYNQNPIDIAFLGTSHTMNGINDELVDYNIKNKFVVNLGYCRTGRDLTYTLINNLFAQKKVEHLVLDVRDYEARYGHPMFPYLANTKEVLLSTSFFNKNYLDGIWTNIVYKTEMWQDQLYHNSNEEKIKDENYGFYTSSRIVDAEILDKAKIKKSKIKDSGISLVKKVYGNFSKSYLKKIANICQKNNVRLTFIYIPAYGSNREKPFSYETYRALGDIWFPPKDIFNKKENWQDVGHLNTKGANELSQWISKKINMELTN